MPYIYENVNEVIIKESYFFKKHKQIIHTEVTKYEKYAGDDRPFPCATKYKNMNNRQ